MTGTIILVVLVLALVAALEYSHRRHSSRLISWGQPVSDDRDLARTKLDLLALGGTAEPFSHKPAARPDTVVSIHRARLSQPHNHAA